MPGIIANLADALPRWRRRIRARRELAAMDERMLGDIGLTESDVRWEVSRPFWRPLWTGSPSRR